MVASGADVLVEILHFTGPMAPSRVMILDQSNLEAREKSNLIQWLCAQLKILKRAIV